MGDRSIKVLTAQVQSRRVKSIWNFSTQVGAGLVKIGQVKSTNERLSRTGVTKFSGHQQFRDPTFYWTKSFLDPRYFWTINFVGPTNFFGPKFLYTHISYYTKVFFTQNLFRPNFLWTKYLFVPKIFWKDISLDSVFNNLELLTD